MLNVLLGQGNDRLTITGTLDPATESYTPVTFTGALDIAPSAGAGTWFTLTRATARAGRPARASDFVVGQQVLISGVAGHVARRRGRRQRPHARARRRRAGARRRDERRQDRLGARAARRADGRPRRRQLRAPGRTRRSTSPRAASRAATASRGSTTATRSASASRSTARRRRGSITGFADATCTLPPIRSRAAARARRCCSAARRSRRRRTSTRTRRGRRREEGHARPAR